MGGLAGAVDPFEGDEERLVHAVIVPVSYTHLRAHETVLDLVCRLLLEQTKTQHTTELSRKNLRHTRPRRTTDTRPTDRSLTDTGVVRNAQ